MRSPYFTAPTVLLRRIVLRQAGQSPCSLGNSVRLSWHFDPIPGRAYGGLRITGAPHEAQVLADGYYVGIVDDFDGVFQHPTASEALRLA